jgi:hypothetical protein
MQNSKNFPGRTPGPPAVRGRGGMVGRGEGRGGGRDGDRGGEGGGDGRAPLLYVAWAPKRVNPALFTTAFDGIHDWHRSADG